MGFKSHTKQISCRAIFILFSFFFFFSCFVAVVIVLLLGLFVCFCRIICKRLPDKISFHINTKKTFYRIPDA